MWEFILSIFYLIFGQTSGDNCRIITHHEVEHIVCSYKLDEISIKLMHENDESKAYGYLYRVKSALNSQNTPPLMLMNGGMYHENLAPVGLYIQEGIEKQKISTKAGWGNFHLLPNGVFWIDGDKVGIEETQSYIDAKRSPNFATQSGPMLLIDGKLHPRFIKDSKSIKIRNGVGLSRDKKTIHFALSKTEINFWNFATLFRDELDADNALFLDGTVSAIEAEKFRRSTWAELGVFIAVFPKNTAK